MQIEGKLIVKNDTETYGSNGFRKREFVIETESQYPQKILVELVQDKTALLDPFNLGDGVKASININGREWVNDNGEKRYFNSIQAWRLEKTNSQPENGFVPK